MAVTNSDDIAKRFKLDPSLYRVHGKLPNRPVFAKVPPYFDELTTVSNGQHIAEGVSVHWEDDDVELEMMPYDKGWKFHFARNPGGFFSIAWGLSDNDIIELNTKRMISIGYEEIEATKAVLSHVEVNSNLHFLRKKNSHHQTAPVQLHDGRYQGSYSLDNKDIPWSTAVRVWADIMFTNPKFKTMAIVHPMLWVQDLAPL